MEYGTANSGQHSPTWTHEPGSLEWYWVNVGTRIAVYVSPTATRAEVSSALNALAELLSGKAGTVINIIAILDEIFSSMSSDMLSDWDTHVHPFQ